MRIKSFKQVAAVNLAAMLKNKNPPPSDLEEKLKKLTQEICFSVDCRDIDSVIHNAVGTFRSSKGLELRFFLLYLKVKLNERAIKSKNSSEAENIRYSYSVIEDLEKAYVSGYK